MSAVTADLVIMFSGMGIDVDLDFGMGAYFYTGIPKFEKMFTRQIICLRFQTG